MTEKQKVTDAEFVVVEPPRDVPIAHVKEPMLTAGWPKKLAAMLVVLAIGTLFLLHANGDWPFNR
ncbi:hypothetical protein LJR164_001638 [Phenylobacterium sp. LjRoot164]|uniref:hypothetical protein n=1 Tax=unclassified Phenylobacterium TaxID=2640670 RepID=UPI003ECF3534